MSALDIRVTSYDPLTGDSETQELPPDGYVLVVGERMKLVSAEGHGTGKIVLTIEQDQ